MARGIEMGGPKTVMVGGDKDRIEERMIIEKAEGGEKAIRGKRGEEMKKVGEGLKSGRCSLRSSLEAVRGRITRDATVREDTTKIRSTISYKQRVVNKQQQAGLKKSSVTVGESDREGTGVTTKPLV